MVALCETAILVSARWGTPIAAMIALHGAVIVGLSGYLIARLRSGSDTSTLAVALVASASTGPIGAIGVRFCRTQDVIVTVRLNRSASSPGDLNQAELANCSRVERPNQAPAR